MPLYQQVAHFLRDNITAGLIPDGSRLPSSRRLAGMLDVSRTTVVSAYSQLLAEGYIVGHIGSGTFVRQDKTMRVDEAAIAEADAPPARHEKRTLSARGRRYAEVDLDALALRNVPFNTGVVRIDARTRVQWRQLAAAHIGIEPHQLGYTDPQGEAALRREIVKYLAVARGVRCSESEVILTAGAQQAFDLAIKVLIDPGETVWVEDPGYPLLRYTLETNGARIEPVGVDADGLLVHEGVASSPDARAAFVTPSHQYPLGVTLSLERRADLLDWAERHDAWIVEDDYDAEFRYSGPALPALKALDRSDRVMYVGSFSKVLFPGMRCGYIVVPPRLVKPFVAARFFTDRHSPFPFAGILSEFMDRGYFVSHIRRRRADYCRSRDLLVDLLRRELGAWIEVDKPGQGMHLTAYLEGGLSDVTLAEAARAEGLMVRPISRLYQKARPRSGLMLGFTGFDEHTMRAAAHRLAGVFAKIAG